MADRVDGSAEDQILYSAVTVRAHHQEVRSNGFRQAYDLRSRCIGVPDNGLGFYVLLPQRLDNAIQVFTTGLNFRRGRLMAVDLTCNTFFNVKQVDFGLMGPR